MVQPTSRQEPASGIHTPPVKAVPRVEPTLPEAPLRPLIKDGQRVSQRGTSASTLAIETIASQASSRADAIDQAATKVTGGNAVARRFNSLVNVLTHDQQTLGQARQNAIQAYRTDLPHALAEYRTLTAKAGKDPVKQQAAQAFLQGAIAKADKAGQAFDRSLQALGGTNKFWSGLTADVGAGMLVMGTAAIASRRFGVPIGPKLIAAGFGGGGAATVGTHAMLDNQYDLRHEGAANFLVGGMGSAGMLWAGKAFQVPTLSMKRLVVSQAVVGAATGSAGAVAQEASTGFKKGWGGRVALSTVVGTAVGAGAGALTPVLAKSLGLSATTLARRSTQMALGLTTGGIAGGGAALANEAFTGFSEGWQSRLKQQSLGGALAGTVYAAAPQLASRRIASGQLSHPTTAAPLIPESVRTVLSAKLKDMGLPTTDLHGGDALLSRLLQDDALSSLRLQVLNDPTIAPEVRSRLAAYSTEAMTAGLQTPEAKLMRLDMLAMALPKATRQLLTASIGKHLQTHSDHLKQFVRQHPTESAWDVVVVGGGSQGTIIGHEANTKGAGHSVLIMDQGVGEGNFGTLREFYMNTLNGVHDGGVVAQKGRSKNPVHGSPVQPSDLSAEMFPTAAAMGDASTIGLYGAQKAGTDVMTGTKVLKVQENKGQGWPARYRIEAGDGTVVFANKVVFSTGLAGEPNLPNHAGTKALVKQEMALIEAQDPQAIATQRLLTDNQLLTLANQADDPLAVWRTTDGPTYIIGGGDGAKIAAELPLGLAPGSAYDHSSAQQGGPGDIIMVGVPTLGPRYNRLQTAIDTGHLGILDGRLESISEIPGSRRLLLTIKPKDGGEAIQVEAGRVVLSTGARSAMGDVLKDILPADFNAETTTLKDAESPHVETIFAHDDAHGAPIEVADQLKAGETSQDIFFAGAAGRIKTRGKGYPFLKDFGNRNLILANKIVAGDAPVIGLKPQRRQIAVTPAMALKSPSTSVRGRILQGLGKAFGEQLSVAPRSMAEGTIGMASIKSASMPANNTPLTIKVGLSEILHKRFTFPGLTRLDLTLTRNEGGSLVLRSPQLDQASLHALAAAIQSDQALSQHLGGFASMGRRQVEIKVDIGTDAVIKPGTMGLMY